VRFFRGRTRGGGANPCGEEFVLANSPGSGPKHLRSRHRYDLRRLCDPDLGFALTNNLSSLGARGAVEITKIAAISSPFKWCAPIEQALLR
jgi:hypothetical protein